MSDLIKEASSAFDLGIKSSGAAPVDKARKDMDPNGEAGWLTARRP